MRRSEAINLTKPDPTILTRGLLTITSSVLASEYQANFRTSLVRNSLSVDVSPTYETVDAYHKHLLAEMEGLASGTSANPSATAALATIPPTRLKELRTGQGLQGGTPSSTATASPTSPATSDDLQPSVAISGRPRRAAFEVPSALSGMLGMGWSPRIDAWLVEERDIWQRNVQPRRALHQGRHPQQGRLLRLWQLLLLTRRHGP